jgi:hypothetical protein
MILMPLTCRVIRHELTGQEIAALTSSATFCSTAGLHFFSA